MIGLKEYREYWERVTARVPALTECLPVTIDKEMAAKIQRIKKETVTLFFLPPAAQSIARDPDNYREDTQCIVLVMAKYDPQRETSFDVLERTQPIIEEIKGIMQYDAATGCPVMRIDWPSLNTLPETEFYADFAGWSLGFTITR